MVRVVRILSASASVIFAFALFCAPLHAQIATAEINGRVTDSSGAVLPGATVTMTQTATGLVRSVVTDGSGTYLISNLPTIGRQMLLKVFGKSLHRRLNRPRRGITERAE